MNKFVVPTAIFFLCLLFVGKTTASVTISSPQNTTYTTNNIPLTWSSTGTMEYCLFNLNGANYYNFTTCYSGTAIGTIFQYGETSNTDYADIEIDSEDNPLVLYCNNTIGSLMVLKYKRSFGTIQKFDTHMSCSGSYIFFKPIKIVREKGTSIIDIIYCNNVVGGMLQRSISYDDGENWSFLENITGCIGGVSGLDAVSDDNGKLHIVFQNASYKVTYSTNKNGNWTFKDILGFPLHNQDIPAIDEQNGKICIGYGRGCSIFPSTCYGVFYAYYNGTDWFLNTNNTYTANKYGSSCAVFDDNDNCFIGIPATATLLWKINQTGSSRFVTAFGSQFGCDEAVKGNEGKIWFLYASHPTYDEQILQFFNPSTESFELTFAFPPYSYALIGGMAIDKWNIPFTVSVSSSGFYMRKADIPLYPQNTNFYAGNGQNNMTIFYTESGDSFTSQSVLFQVGNMECDVMCMMCGAGSYFTGTDYSGGCQVASLFLLAIILSVIGWLFKYLKHEYGEEIPDKYLISGVISAFFIIGFMAIGMSDLLTGIMAVVLILTMIVSYSQTFGGGKK